MAKFGIQNPLLEDEVKGQDFLYHLGFDTKTTDVKKEFGDTKFVCMGGSASRARALAERLVAAFGDRWNVPVTRENGKVGPVISVSHGMGMPSMSILLHEIAKLMYHAGATGVEFIRLGTSGGLGLEPGTVVITSRAVCGDLRAVREVIILGEHVERPTTMNLDLVKAIEEAQKTPYNEDDVIGGFDVVSGATMGTDDFYEGQGRCDGAICQYDKVTRDAFIQRCHDAGVRNMEMESPEFASFCNVVGIRGAVICVTLVNRVAKDQVDVSSMYEEFGRRVHVAAMRYINKRLKQ